MATIETEDVVIASTPSCNTNEPLKESHEYRIKSKNICLTLNGETMKKLEEILNYLGKYKACNYILACGHNLPDKHIHIYVQYENATSISTKWLFGAHVEKCEKSAQANIKYIKGEDKKHKMLNVKSEILHEWGEARLNGGGNRIKDIINMNDKQIKNQDWKMYNVIKKIKNDYEDEKNIDKWLEDRDIKVYWHCGKSGSGKTYSCKNRARELRAKGIKVAVINFDTNGFAHIIGSKDAEMIIINEFRDTQIRFKDFLEILTNEYVYNIKGGHVYFSNLNEIWINSIQYPELIYRNCDEDRYQIERRITKIYVHNIVNGEYVMREKPFNSLLQDNNTCENHDDLSDSQRLDDDKMPSELEDIVDLDE